MAPARARPAMGARAPAPLACSGRVVSGTWGTGVRVTRVMEVTVEVEFPAGTSGTTGLEAVGLGPGTTVEFWWGGTTMDWTGMDERERGMVGTAVSVSGQKVVVTVLPSTSVKVRVMVLGSCTRVELATGAGVGTSVSGQKVVVMVTPLTSVVVRVTVLGASVSLWQGVSEQWVEVRVRVDWITSVETTVTLETWAATRAAAEMRVAAENFIVSGVGWWYL